MSRVKASQQVYRGSKSLDFISNFVKNVENVTASTPSLVNLEPSNKTFDFKAKQIKHTRTPKHPYYRPTEIQKLQTVLDVFQRPIHSFFVDVELDSKNSEIADSLRFGSPKEAFDLFNKYREFEQLEVLGRGGVSFKIDMVDAKFKQKIDEVIISDFDNLLTKQLKNNEGLILSNEDKVVYFISGHLENTDIKKTTSLITRFIKESQNSRIAERIFNAYVFRVRTLPKQTARLYENEIDSVTRSLLENYSSLEENVRVLNSLVLINKLYGRYEKVKDLILRLKQYGYVPDSECVAFLIRYLVTKHSGDRTAVLKELSGFDDVIFSVFDGSVAKSLIMIAETTEELVSILNLLEAKIRSSRELEYSYKSFESYLVPKILKSSNSSHAAKIQLINRVQKFTELSQKSKWHLLETSVREGSFILASTMISKEKGYYDSKTRGQLKTIALERSIFIEAGKPGYDEVSRNAFLRLIDY